MIATLNGGPVGRRENLSSPAAEPPIVARMDVRQLAYFLRIAEKRSISAAAVSLNVTQPTLTKSVRLLEQELGVVLLERLPRGVELTVYGRSLLRHAQAVKLQLEDAVGEIEGLATGAAGTVTIGAGPAWLRRHLPLAVARAIAVRPRLAVRIVGGFDEALLRGLRHGDLDFVVAELTAAEREDDLEIEALTMDALAVCCRAGHPLDDRSALDLKTLLQYPWVLPEHNSNARCRLEAGFVARGEQPPVPALETESMAFLFAMLRCSDALTYTTAMTVRAPDGAGLALLDVPALRMTRSAGLVTRRGAWLSPAAGAVIEELRAICAENPEN